MHWSLPSSDLAALIITSPRLTFIVACFTFIVDLSQQVLIVRELFLVHAAHLALVCLLGHLSVKEILVIAIDTLDLMRKALLLQLVVLLICPPDHSLLVVQGLLGLLTPLFLLHLAIEQLAHVVFLLALALHASLVLEPCSHLLFLLVVEQHLLLLLDAALLLGDDVAGQCVHEVLSAGLAGTELT